MKKKKLSFLVVCMAFLMAVSGCGNTESEEAVAPVQEKEEEPVAEPEDEGEDEGKEEEEAAPEPEPEEEKILTYAEEKELKFSDETSVTISGVRRNPENLDDFDVIDSEWEISGITVEDSEDGKVITVEQRVSGYIWGNDDGSVFKTDISLPGGLFCDTYTGAIIPATNMVEDMQTEHTTEIEWDGKTYTIKREESAKWEDGEWGPNPEGEGYVLLSTLYITNILTVSNDYDGLAMILSPLTGVSDSDLENAGVINEEEKYILDVLEDDGYLFSIAKAYESLNGVSMADALNGNEAEVGAGAAETSDTESVKEIGKGHEHDFAAATCTKPQVCTQCQEEEGEALGHDFAEATCTEPKTCRRCKMTEGEALGHSFVQATCETPSTCQRCGSIEGEALGHNYQLVESGTEENQLYERYRCLVCEKEYMDYQEMVLDESTVYSALIGMQDSYPEGTPWTNDNEYSWKGGIYSSGGGCAGFAFLLSDAAFGSARARKYFDSSEVRVGDIARMDGDSHSVIILEVNSDSVTVAEGNFNGAVHWGRKISKSTLENANYFLTRY